MMRKRIARRAAALETAAISAGIAASDADANFRALLDTLTGVLDGLPPITLDDDADDGADAAAAWQDGFERAVIWQDVMRRTTSTISVARITSVLRLACVTIAHLTLRLHQRTAALHRILARLARYTLFALAHARLRVAHLCITARAMRAGRVAVLASTAPAGC